MVGNILQDVAEGPFAAEIKEKGRYLLGLV
jgi:hypothetical protein